MNLHSRRHWIFDLDGTLTDPVHDFDAIRGELGLPLGQPILEALAAKPAHEAAELTRRLDVLEADLATATGPAPGAAALLEDLRRRECALGIVTRNSVDNAWRTLEHCGLSAYFERSAVLGRDETEPKPSPAGVEWLLRRWGASPDTGVMIGDFRYDLEAGRAAGVATVSVDPSGQHEWAALADVCVESLIQLVAVD